MLIQNEVVTSEIIFKHFLCALKFGGFFFDARHSEYHQRLYFMLLQTLGASSQGLRNFEHGESRVCSSLVPEHQLELIAPLCHSQGKSVIHHFHSAQCSSADASLWVRF